MARRRRSSWDEQPDLFLEELWVESRKRPNGGEIDRRYEALKAPLKRSAKTTTEYERGIRAIVKRIRY